MLCFSKIPPAPQNPGSITTTTQSKGNQGAAKQAAGPQLCSPVVATQWHLLTQPKAPSWPRHHHQPPSPCPSIHPAAPPRGSQTNTTAATEQRKLARDNPKPPLVDPLLISPFHFVSLLQRLKNKKKTRAASRNVSNPLWELNHRLQRQSLLADAHLPLEIVLGARKNACVPPRTYPSQQDSPRMQPTRNVTWGVSEKVGWLKKKKIIQIFASDLTH